MKQQSGTLITSPFSDDIVPHLSERDARVLVGQVTEAIRRLGVLPSQVGVQLESDGFWFTAIIKGKAVTARAGESQVFYDRIARDLVLASTDPHWDTLTIQKG